MNSSFAQDFRFDHEILVIVAVASIYLMDKSQFHWESSVVWEYDGKLSKMPMSGMLHTCRGLFLWPNECVIHTVFRSGSCSCM